MRKPVDQQPTPGSPEAIVLGCTCSPIANHGGRGRFRAPFGRVYDTDWQCPIHGLAEALAEVKAGRADILRNEPEHTRTQGHRKKPTSRRVRR
jgi:hypothetical protein